MKNENVSRMLSEQALQVIAARFRVLCEPNRWKILQCLKEAEKTVGEIINVTGLSQTNTSHHLAALSEAGILTRRKQGTTVLYSVQDITVFELFDLVCDSFQRRLSEHVKAFEI